MSRSSRAPSAVALRRIQTELNDWASSPPEGCALEPLQADNMMHWTITMKGPDSTEWAQSLYEGETFRVSIRFTDNYPLESPEVVFLPPAPIHPHIYSNGHICLDILYDGRNGGWSPALTISKVIISLRSMLASSTDKKRPVGNDEYVARMGHRSPKETNWVFEDHNV